MSIETTVNAETFRGAQSTADFEAILSQTSGLSDRQMQIIAKKLWGRSSRTRQHAIENIRSWWNRESLHRASFAALDRTPI